jgi:YD repeat-containing protein
VQVTGLNDVVAIAAGDDHSMALRNDGSVWTWGYNRNGEVGDGSTTNRVSPVAVTGVGEVTAIAAGTNHSLALRSDGTAWAWGRNANGQLGDTTNTTSTSPVQVAGLGQLSTIAAGDNHSLASASDGTIWTWGRNFRGQLGDGTTTNRSTPTAVEGLSGGGTEASYDYDGDGLRSAKTTPSGTTAFTWDHSGGLPLMLTETTASTATHYVYGPGGLPISRIDTSGDVVYYHADQLGSTRARPTPRAPWSRQRPMTPTASPRRQRACSPSPSALLVSTPTQTGFQYLRARYYDPGTAQFLNRDPLEPITGTPYAYAGSDPLNYTDPSGLFRIPGTNICVDIADPNCRSIKEQHQEGSQQVANFAGGVLNTLTFGNERRINSALGQEDKVDRCSGWYTGGEVAGLAVPAGGVGSAWKAGREIKIGQNLRIAPFGNRAGHSLGRRPHYHRRSIDPATDLTRPGQGIGRHRPWETKGTDTSFWNRF